MLMILKTCVGISVLVQWRTVHTPNAGGLVSIPGQATRSHMPELRPSSAK